MTNEVNGELSHRNLDVRPFVHHFLSPVDIDGERSS